MIELCKKLLRFLQVKRAVRYANKMHTITRRRYYVIKIFNKVRVYDRAHVNFLIKEGVLSKKMRDALFLQENSIYFTK
jgi:hypothetical protein